MNIGPTLQTAYAAANLATASRTPRERKVKREIKGEPMPIFEDDDESGNEDSKITVSGDTNFVWTSEDKKVYLLIVALPKGFRISLKIDGDAQTVLLLWKLHAPIYGALSDNILKHPLVQGANSFGNLFHGILDKEGVITIRFPEKISKKPSKWGKEKLYGGSGIDYQVYLIPKKQTVRIEELTILLQSS